MTLQLLHSEFPYTVYEENLIFFFISVFCNQKNSEKTTVPRRFLNVVVGFCQVSSSYNGHVVFETSEEWEDKPNPLFPEGSEDSDPIGGYRQNTKDTKENH
jgi:hypothetical protein